MLRKDCNLARMQQTTGDQRWVVRYEVMVMVMCDQDQVYGCCKTGYILLATLYIHIHSPTVSGILPSTGYQHGAGLSL